MVDFSLTDEQKMLQRTAHDFAQKEIRPIAKEMDRNSDPQKSVPWDVIKKGLQLGFGSILMPEKYGGYDGGWLDYCLVAEELAWGDVGVAIVLMTTSFEMSLLKYGNETQKEKWYRFAQEDAEMFLAAGVATEPPGGSELVCPLPDPALGVKTTAVRDGDEYVLNGQKCFITNGGCAKLYFVTARTDMTKPNLESCSLFIVPADTPGLMVGKIEDKMGYRGCQNAELFFENARIPVENLLGEEGQGFTFQEAVSHGMGLGVGAIAVGLARAAYEEALNYSDERVIWGKPIRKHQLVASKLVDMRMKIEASRALVWKLCWAMDHPELSDGLDKLASMGKVFPTNLIRGITIETMQILGGYGYIRDFPVEKYVRDAMIMPIYDTTNEVLTLFLAEQL